MSCTSGVNNADAMECSQDYFRPHNKFIWYIDTPHGSSNLYCRDVVCDMIGAGESLVSGNSEGIA